MLYDYYHLGNEEQFRFSLKEYKKTGGDFRNDLCNGMIKFYPDYFEDEKKFCKALFIKKYPSSLSDRFLNEITSLPVHSITSIDVVPVPKDLTTKTLQKKYMGIESDIIKQQRVRNRNNDFSSEISYGKRTEKREIEAIMDDVRENDQCLFYVAVTIILMADSKKELESMEYVSKNPFFYHWYPFFLFLLGTGCRIGEAIGIRWDDIDMETRVISINHSLTYYREQMIPTSVNLEFRSLRQRQVLE